MVRELLELTDDIEVIEAADFLDDVFFVLHIDDAAAGQDLMAVE